MLHLRHICLHTPHPSYPSRFGSLNIVSAGFKFNSFDSLGQHIRVIQQSVDLHLTNRSAESEIQFYQVTPGMDV